MPSYRVTAEVGLLQPGVAAPDVLPQAVAVAEAMTTVEAHDVAVVRGQARVTVTSGAGGVEIDGETTQGIGAGTVLTTDGFDEGDDHYEITIAGGLGSLTIDRT